MREIKVNDLLENKGDGLPDPETILMFSGGKDSTYLLWYCLKNDIKIDRIVFCDTTIEYPAVYEWIEYIESRFGIEVLRVIPKNTFHELIMRIRKRGKFKGRIRGFPAMRFYCWVSRDLKFHASTDRVWPDATRLIAILGDEEYRLEMKATLKHKVRWPLIEAGICEKQVIRELKENDLYPPIYSLLEKYITDPKQRPRTGCWICPKTNIAGMRMLYFEYPELWKQLEDWEELAPLLWKMTKTVKEWGDRFEKEGRPPITQ